jgi:hypothetical protein
LRSVEAHRRRKASRTSGSWPVLKMPSRPRRLTGSRSISARVRPAARGRRPAGRQVEWFSRWIADHRLRVFSPTPDARSRATP